MKGKIDPNGTVTITFDAKGEMLMAPQENGVEMKYLPCYECGKLEVVRIPVVTTICKACWQREELTFTRV